MTESREVNLLVQGRRMIYGSATFRNLEGKHGFVGGRGFSCGAKGDISRLNHEAGHDSVKWDIIVCATCAEGKKVLGGLGDCFAE